MAVAVKGVGVVNSRFPTLDWKIPEDLGGEEVEFRKGMESGRVVITRSPPIKPFSSGELIKCSLKNSCGSRRFLGPTWRLAAPSARTISIWDGS